MLMNWGMEEEGMGDHEKKEKIYYMPLGLCIGTCMGVAIGSWTGNMSVCMTAGMCFGLLVGALLDGLGRKDKA